MSEIPEEPEEPKKVPDNIVEFSRNTLRQMMEDAGKADREIPYSSEEARLLKELNNKYALVHNYFGYTRVVYQDRGSSSYSDIAPAEFALIHSNETVIIDPVKGTSGEVGKWWLRHNDRRTYSTTVFDPESLERDKFGQLIIGDKMNLYTGFGVAPVKGPWRKMLRHIYRVICKRDKLRFKFVMRWLAWGVQNPGRPAGVCVVFQGKKGAGKGFLANTMVSIYGQHGQSISNRKQLTGNFNSHLERCCFLVADEAYYPGDKDVEGVLKAVITEPTIQIEGKFQKARPAKNCLKIMMCTNNDWVIPASGDERRFFVTEVSDEYTLKGSKRRSKTKYFNTLAKELDGGGREAMLYYLQNMQLGDWKPWHDVPRTEELEAQIFKGLGQGQKAVCDLLSEGVLPSDNKRKVRGQNLHAHMMTIMQNFQRCPSKQFGDALRDIGVTKKRMATGIVWEFPTLMEARDAFIQHFGAPPEPFQALEDGSEDWIYKNPTEEF